jgi:hypothetical protein
MKNLKGLMKSHIDWLKLKAKLTNMMMLKRLFALLGDSVTRTSENEMYSFFMI